MLRVLSRPRKRPDLRVGTRGTASNALSEQWPIGTQQMPLASALRGDGAGI